MIDIFRSSKKAVEFLGEFTKTPENLTALFSPSQKT
jgi:hypothetical protein